LLSSGNNVLIADLQKQKSEDIPEPEEIDKIPLDPIKTPTKSEFATNPDTNKQTLDYLFVLISHESFQRLYKDQKIFVQTKDKEVSPTSQAFRGPPPSNFARDPFSISVSP